MAFQPLTPAEPQREPFRFQAWHGLVVVGALTIAVPGAVLLARRPPPPPAPGTVLYGEPADTALGGGRSEGGVNLAPDQAPTLAIYTVPVGVEITLDGEQAGRSPFRLTDAERRPYRVALRADGYVPVDTVMHLDVNPRSLLAIDLVPDGTRPVPPAGAVVEAAPAEAPAVPAPVDDRPGELSVAVVPWGTIYVDGQLMARETDVRQSFSLPPGTHTVAAEHPSLGRREIRVEIRPGQSRSVTVEL